MKVTREDLHFPSFNSVDCLNLLSCNAVITLKISMLNRKYLAILNFKSLVHPYRHVKRKAYVIVHKSFVTITENLNPLIQA